jgi:predicted nucleic acid-binding protein
VFLRRITPTAGANAQSILDGLRVHIIQDERVRRRAREIAERLNLPRVYDATYATLAELRGCDLWTGDEQFFNAVHRSLTFVKFIGTY